MHCPPVCLPSVYLAWSNLSGLITLTSKQPLRSQGTGLGRRNWMACLWENQVYNEYCFIYTSSAFFPLISPNHTCSCGTWHSHWNVVEEVSYSISLMNHSWKCRGLDCGPAQTQPSYSCVHTLSVGCSINRVVYTHISVSLLNSTPLRSNLVLAISPVSV